MDQQALDPVLVQEVLSKQPFVTVEGTYNVRDLHHTDAHSVFPSCSCTSGVKPGLLFRSGELSALTDRGKSTMGYLPNVYEPSPIIPHLCFKIHPLIPL
jgi:hypothetical protein